MGGTENHAPQIRTRSPRCKGSRPILISSTTLPQHPATRRSTSLGTWPHASCIRACMQTLRRMPAAPSRATSILPLGCEEIINVSQGCNTQKPSGQETYGGTNAFPRVHTRHGTKHARFVRAHVNLHKTRSRANNYIKGTSNLPSCSKRDPACPAVFRFDGNAPKS